MKALTRVFVLFGLVAAACMATACATWRGFAAPHPDQLRARPEVALGDVRLLLHLSRPAAGPAPRLLLFHVTGDSGWHGLDTIYFDAMAARGYAIAGASARALRARLGEPGAATPQRLAADYLALIDMARARLQLASNTPVILTGLSRGAGLTVVAAAQSELARRTAGVVIMGLTADETHVRPAAAPFGWLDRIERPLVLVQSTVDRHVPAAQARGMFGPDTPARRLVPIDAEGHTFVGGRDELFRAVAAGIEWIATGAQVELSPRDGEIYFEG